jgi:hypothetical protein
MSRRAFDRRTLRILLIAAAIAVLASPTWLWPGRRAVFPLVSLAYAGVIVTIVRAWGQSPSEAPAKLRHPQGGGTTAGILTVAALGAALVAFAAYRLVWLVLLNPPDPAHGDMLTVIELGGRRFLRGRDPYATYQVPWNVNLPYGPPLWAPFLLPMLLGVDLRLLTVGGQLFVPVCCGAAAAVDAARARWAPAAAWLLLLATLVFNPDLLRFAAVGHTPAYWPLLPLLAVSIAGERWTLGAAVLGILAAGRFTMMAMVPVFFIGLWRRDRSRLMAAALTWAAVVTLILLPFFLWDSAAMWEGLITNYTTGLKRIVWPSGDEGAIRTIGLTGWLLAHGLERFVELSQMCAMAIVYAVAWRAIARGAAILPCMALALCAFSMTTVWPVYYIHFDVVLLLVSAAAAEAAEAPGRYAGLRVWPVVLVSTAVLVVVAVGAIASPTPSVFAAETLGPNLLPQGFLRPEDDGARRFRWISGTRATILLPRSSASAADLSVTAQPFVPPGSGPQQVTAMLNGIPLGTRQVDGGWQTIRWNVPNHTWRVGSNELQLLFPPARSLKELGLGDDPRSLSMAVGRIEVTAR